MVIDTPGMRELGLFDVDEGIATAFPDVEALFARCRFADCNTSNRARMRRESRPFGRNASQERWDSYQSQQRENRYLNSKAAYMASKRAFGKSIAKWNKERKKRSINNCQMKIAIPSYP